MESEPQKTGITYDITGFSTRLKKLRKFRGFRTQASVTKTLQLSRQVFSLWEKGKRYPNVFQLQILAVFFQVNISYFFVVDAIPEQYELELLKDDSGSVFI